MIKFESSAHWYSRDGNPKHGADLRVARKALLYPSVTTINKDVFKNDFLEKYKMNELAAAAADTFKQPHETNEDYANRLYELSLEKARTAAQFGKEIHDAIENYPLLPIDARLHPWLDKFGRWHDANIREVLHRERVLLDSDIGVAGRCDFIGICPRGSLIIPDWKTQNVKKDKKGVKSPAFYDDWVRQLAFYAVSYSKEAGIFPNEIPTCISVVIDSNEPEEPFVKVWSKEEILDHYQDFLAGCYLWFSKRNYWPVGKWKITFPFRMPS